MRHRGYAQRTVIGLFGPLIYRRPRYEIVQSGQVIMPSDQRLDVPDGCELSPALADRGLWLASEMSFVHVQEAIFRTLRIKVCDSVLDRVMQRVGMVAVNEDQKQMQPLKQASPARRLEMITPLLSTPPRRIYVSCDGAMFPTRQSVKRKGQKGKRRLHRELKCGMVFWEDEQLGWCKKVICGRESIADFGLRLWSLAIACGLNQCQEAIFISDGGKWCEAIHRQFFRELPRILDWYHLKEHIRQTAQLIYPDSPEKTKRWTDRCLARLEQRSGIGLLLMLQRVAPRRRGQKRQAVQDLIHYLKPRLDFTDYQFYRQRGWIIGSGAMESTCKQVVGHRLKGTGRQWSEQGALAMAQLVTLRLNGNWDEFWATRPLRAAA